ncbi:DUF6471 domain-containing protein [Brumicola nitratireducens]|uniref:GMP synthase, PP-ATPase domain/subunit i n=1 Tax=Glaciecola nitratireducens (strain JCM 12485 / KCTC 12276 / FR1064) TaxID=1085623 RepID=G4QK23_GLANF|nr:DUF6471 domain-containing protein [Glaciecola nitratireducens]AEP29145.1 GMP synthase, PP-ATPase domain/subunit i [Glaciecola nitratireducens FR1064]|tara:strand:- start:194 stop:451 length:258 start_codon:yes stop_codon:yes gene_type:complete
MKPKASDWRKLVERLLKAELSKKGIKYQDLSDKLSAVGVNQSADNLRNKINKGILGSDLLFQIIFVLNIKQIKYEDIEEMLSDMQ